MFRCCSLETSHPRLLPQSKWLFYKSVSLFLFCIKVLFTGFGGGGGVQLLSSVQSLCRVQLFETPWTEACQASLSITNSWSLLTQVHWVSEAIQPSHPLLSPSPPTFNLSASASFQMSQFLASGGQSIGVSASASVLPMNIQDWIPLGWTGDFGTQENKVSPCFHCFPIYLPWSDGTGCHDLSFLNVEL